MKHTKVLISVFVGASLLFSAGSALAVENTALPQNGAAVMAQNQAVKWEQKQAIVKTVSTDGSQITIETADDNKTELVLNISDETIFINNKTGEKTSVQQVKAGDSIYVYHSLAMTRSLPPQTAAIAIVTDLEEKATPAHLIEVQSVAAKADGSVQVQSADGNVILTVLPDKPIALLNGEKAATADIKAGDQIFGWYDIITLSLPGQATAQRTVIAKQAAADATTPAQDEEQAYTVAINGQTLDLQGQAVLERNSELLVPLRPVAEKLGFELKWNVADMSAAIDDGQVKTVVKIGSNNYYKASSQADGLTAAKQYNNAPLMHENHTYVPVKLFQLLYSNDNAVTVNGNTIAIQK